MSGDRQLKLEMHNHTTLDYLDATLLSTISISNPNVPSTSSNNLLAYRPRYPDSHSSNLAGIFINLPGVFPCLKSTPNYAPIYHILTEEEDGFRNGKAFIDAGDSGIAFNVFSSTRNIVTYGMAIQDCPEFTVFCFPSYYTFTVACYLPRATCSRL
jgi:hypothetical protein